MPALRASTSTIHLITLGSSPRAELCRPYRPETPACRRYCGRYRKFPLFASQHTDCKSARADASQILSFGFPKIVEATRCNRAAAGATHQRTSSKKNIANRHERV